MERNRELAKQADDTLGTLISGLAAVPAEQFNTIPFARSWTAGQLAQHMIMANSGFADVMNGPVKDTERAPDTMVEKIKSDFLNFDIVMKSPDFLRPEEKNYDKDGLLAALSGIKTDIVAATSSLDLTKTCLSFELPVYGYLTRLEAVSFIIYHTRRHIHQLTNISNQLIK